MSYLGIGRGFQEAEAVSEALAGQTQFDLLLLHEGGGALQNHQVILHRKQQQRHKCLVAKTFLTHCPLWDLFMLYCYHWL